MSSSPSPAHFGIISLGTLSEWKYFISRKEQFYSSWPGTNVPPTLLGSEPFMVTPSVLQRGEELSMEDAVSWNESVQVSKEQGSIQIISYPVNGLLDVLGATWSP